MTRVVGSGRARALAAVAAFVAAFAAIGAVSKSTTTASGITAATAVPYAPWYWTMAVSATDPNVVLVGTNNGVLRSSDGAKTWKPTGPQGVNTTSLVQAGNSIFMGGVPGPNPVIRKGAGRTAPDGSGVLAESTDGGKTFKLLHPKGLPSVTVQALAADPAKSRTLYALLNDGRLYRSSDGARSFQLVAKVGISPWALAVTQGGRLVGGDMDRGGFASTNGKSWQRTPFTDSNGGRMVMEYAVNPSNANEVLMTSVGIERSSDGGTTWHLALKSKVMFGPVAWGPEKSKIAYAIGFDRSFWRSDDGGRTWRQVS